MLGTIRGRESKIVTVSLQTNMAQPAARVGAQPDARACGSRKRCDGWAPPSDGWQPTFRASQAQTLLCVGNPFVTRPPEKGGHLPPESVTARRQGPPHTPRLRPREPSPPLQAPPRRLRLQLGHRRQWRHNGPRSGGTATLLIHVLRPPKPPKPKPLPLPLPDSAPRRRPTPHARFDTHKC